MRGLALLSIFLRGAMTFLNVMTLGELETETQNEKVLFLKILFLLKQITKILI
jgi:hypothetical protein